jgi:hypothetical protein
MLTKILRFRERSYWVCPFISWSDFQAQIGIDHKVICYIVKLFPPLAFGGKIHLFFNKVNYLQVHYARILRGCCTVLNAYRYGINV